MAINDNNRFNKVAVPVFEFDEKGHIKPNPLFHRPWDKLHSRCIEYPFAASRLGHAKVILDVGTSKADPAWINWLENLPIKVYATDYDVPFKTFRNLTFHQADLRQLPLPDNFFDKIMAISVIEHIGLESPQVSSNNIPQVSSDGDLIAFKELARVLKPGGALIMTLPFGVKEGLILGNQARNYTLESIKSFDNILHTECIEYYEYQPKNYTNEKPKDHPSIHWKHYLKTNIRAILCFLLCKIQVNDKLVNDFLGEATWRNLPLSETKAIHKTHTEGVICGVWRK